MTLTGIHNSIYRLEATPRGSGGEGDVYHAYTNVKIAKIYKPGMLTSEFEEKLEIMIKHPPNESVLSQVAWPLEVVYDDNGRCCGFIMPKLNINAELVEVYKYPSTAPITAQQKISIPVKIMDDVVSFSCGEYHTVAITSDGKLWVWRNNEYGQLGDGTTVNRLYPAWIMDNVIDVVAGDAYTMAIKHDGTLWAWGSNENGQLGDGTMKKRLTPVKIMDNMILL
jgi:alpha-tubulin suppressor-like RCC1 family protein